MWTFEIQGFWFRNIFNGLRMKTVATKPLQMIIASPLAQNAILLKSDWVELRFAVFLTSLFYIHCMHIESIHYDTTPGIIITLVGKNVGGKCV